MKKIILIVRVATYDAKNKKILLVRNKGASFWYLPGGNWEYEKESSTDCAKREVFEEVGIHVEVSKLLYVQESRPEVIDEKKYVCLETIWLAHMTHDQELNKDHIDLDPNGSVEEARWFSKEELEDIKSYPKRLKNTFWDNIEVFQKDEDRFIGINLT